MILIEVGEENPHLASHWHLEVCQFVSLLLISTSHWKLSEALSLVRYALFTVFTSGVLNLRLEKKQTINSWKRHVLCDWALSNERNRWEFEHVIGIVWGTKYGQFTPINFAVFLDRQLLLRRIRIRNPIQGGKSIDLHDGMHFVADLISNYFFEVNNVNILCFLGFQSCIECKRYWMVSNYCRLALILACTLMISVGSILSGEFNGKCWYCSHHYWKRYGLFSVLAAIIRENPEKATMDWECWPFSHQPDRVARMANEVSAADWRYQTHVKEHLIFWRVLLQLFSGLKINV